MNASPVIQVGSDRPDSRKSVEVWTRRRNANPIPMTKTK